MATLKDLETGEPRPLDRRVLLDALEAGPWAWCGSRAFIERARALCPGGPRPVEPGETIVLGVTPVSASIFRLLPPPARVSPPPNRELPLGQAACDALAAAAEALPGGLPLLWSRLPSADEASVRPTCWATMARPGVAIAGPPVVLDGLSCGLSFFLSLASRALRRPITHTVAASAEIRGGGVLAPVDGLDAKIRVLLAWAPCVRTLLVAGGQSEEAAAIVDGLGAAAVLHVVGVERARDALAWAIGTDAELDNHLVSLCATPIGLEDTVQDLFQVCIDGARKLSDWAPIQAAATLLESRLHARLDAALRARLQYVACVAHRHTTLRQAPPPLPSNTAWITGLPKTHQPSVLAAYAQHAADYAVPPPAQVVALIASLSPRRAVGATERELDLMGAYGRLLAVDGHARQAFALQMEIAAEHGRLGNWTNTTYQVSEAFRLAGALGDGGLFAEVDAFRERMGSRGGLDPKAGGTAFVLVARARALARVDPAQRRAVAAELTALLRDLRSHLRWAACRTMADIDPAGDGLGLLREGLAGAPQGERQHVERNVALVALDEAVAGGDAAAEHAALEALRRHAAGLVANLLAATGPERRAFAGSDAAWVGRFFPY